MNAIKLLFLLIIFPLLLAGVGTWQLQRATEGAQVPEQAQAYVNVMKPALKTWLEENPTVPITVGSDALSPEQFLSRLARIEAELPTARQLNRVLRTLAPWVMGLGLLAALIGVAALAGTQWAGRRAQQSREQLLQVFSLDSRLLPYVLVSQVVAMARCCCRWRSCASTTRRSNPMKA